jgi:hypothetical protein
LKKIGEQSQEVKKAAVIATGWVGDTIACTAAATSLFEKGYQVTFFARWPQLIPILKNDSRFTVRLYWHLKILRLIKPILNWYFDIVIEEPAKWSYQEPFTAEIRRIAGCTPTTGYQLFLNPHLDGIIRNQFFDGERKPVISISRDIIKRAYGRDLDQLIPMLSEFADIVWVGLDSSKNSKHGKNHSLLNDAKLIASSDLFFGPEGGLLWLAAGIGMPCIYLSENISAVAKNHGMSSLENVLGSKNYFREDARHISLPPYCNNDFIIKKIREFLSTMLLKNQIRK